MRRRIFVPREPMRAMRAASRPAVAARRDAPEPSWRRVVTRVESLPRTAPPPLAMVCSLVLAACGARSELIARLPASADASPNSDVTSIDASRDVTGSDAARDVPSPDVVRLPCSWSVGTLSLVTRLPNDQTAGGSVAVPGGVLVTYTNDNDPSPDPRYYIQFVDELGVPRGDRHALFDHAGSYGPMYLASSGSRYAAMVWDEARGCRFVPIDTSGVPSGPVRTLTTSLCRGLRGTPSGFIESEVLGNALTLRTTDAAGETTSVASDITSGENARSYSMIVFDDGSIGIAWLTASSIVYQRFDAMLSAITMPSPIAPSPTTTTMTVRLATTGSHVAIAWQSAVDAADTARTLSTAEITRDGAIVRAPSTVAGASPLPGRNELVLRLAHDDILAGYIEGADTADWHFEVQVLDASGQPRTAPLTVRGTRFVLDLGIVETMRGALVTYVTAGMGSNQIAATPLTCTQ